MSDFQEHSMKISGKIICINDLHNSKLRVIRRLAQTLAFHLNAAKLEYSTFSSYVFIPLGGSSLSASLKRL